MSQDQLARQTNMCASRSTESCVIRLQAACRDESIALLRKRFAQQEFELSQLVSTTAETHHIIAFDVYPSAAKVTAQFSFEAMKTLNRCRLIQECYAAEPRK
jgi:hypothetical protein